MPTSQHVAIAIACHKRANALREEQNRITAMGARFRAHHQHALAGDILRVITELENARGILMGIATGRLGITPDELEEAREWL